jgi:hypothetical protein
VAEAFASKGPPDTVKLMETYEKYGVEAVPES